MGTKVTIEGSRITPTDKLPAGVRTTVELTPSVQEFINRGFAVVIRREELPDEDPVEVPDVAPDAASDADAGEGSDTDAAPEADSVPDPAADQDAAPAADSEPAEKPSRSTRRGAKTADEPKE